MIPEAGTNCLEELDDPVVVRIVVVHTVAVVRIEVVHIVLADRTVVLVAHTATVAAVRSLIDPDEVVHIAPVGHILIDLAVDHR